MRPSVHIAALLSITTKEPESINRGSRIFPELLVSLPLPSRGDGTPLSLSLACYTTIVLRSIIQPSVFLVSVYFCFHKNAHPGWLLLGFILAILLSYQLRNLAELWPEWSEEYGRRLCSEKVVAVVGGMCSSRMHSHHLVLCVSHLSSLSAFSSAINHNTTFNNLKHSQWQQSLSFVLSSLFTLGQLFCLPLYL